MPSSGFSSSAKGGGEVISAGSLNVFEENMRSSSLTFS